MSAPALPPGASEGGWPMARAMVGVGLVCGLLIVFVYEATRPRIERARAEALRQAVFEVLPGANSSRSFEREQDGHYVPARDGASSAERVHAGFDAENRLVGLALEAAGMGYQDVIRLLYGYAVESETIIGVHVLESRETPGLGDRVESDAGFQANFARLDVSLTADGRVILHPIEVVKPGEKRHPWQIDGLTGATITSKAIGSILRESTLARLPAIRVRLADFVEEVAP
ncbi:MAG: FMN-binding protein [Deltaproteobacteria bacterium]|nr:FMN-binding protein [Deltaproteobacteria bacterium]MBW2393684.1 FMN-binding protein [Deltaproteobacteria bacterium]